MPLQFIMRELIPNYLQQLGIYEWTCEMYVPNFEYKYHYFFLSYFYWGSLLTFYYLNIVNNRVENFYFKLFMQSNIYNSATLF